MISSESRRVQPQLQERRRKLRRSITPLIYLKVSPNNGGLLLDLSESGMCVSLANPLVNSAEIHFSFSLVESRTIEGVGRICWVSESGRKAGVQFVNCSKISHEQIATWLNSEVALGEEPPSGLSLEEVKESETQPRDRSRGSNAADSETGKGSASKESVGKEGLADRIFSNGQRGTAESFTDADAPVPAAGVESRQENPAPTASGTGSGLTIPDTPLFFLPQKKEEHEDVIPDSSSESTESAFSGGTGANAGFDSADFRWTLASGSQEEEKEQDKKSGLGKAVARTALLLLLIVLCFAVYRYKGSLPRLESLIPAANDATIPHVAKKARQSRSVRRSTRPVQESSPIRRVEPSGDVVTFHVPGVNGGSFSVQGMVPGVQGTSLQAAGGGPSSDEGTNAGLGENSQSFPVGDNAGNVSSTTPLVGSASTVKFIGLMATLRNDGALVVEGGFSPSSPKVSKPQSVLEHIVLDVLVGKSGVVKDIRLISSPDSKLAALVIRSVRKWRYQPLYENGEPVEFTTRVTLNFSKPSHNP